MNAVPMEVSVTVVPGDSECECLSGWVNECCLSGWVSECCSQWMVQ